MVLNRGWVVVAVALLFCVLVLRSVTGGVFADGEIVGRVVGSNGIDRVSVETLDGDEEQLVGGILSPLFDGLAVGECYRFEIGGGLVDLPVRPHGQIVRGLEVIDCASVAVP